MVNENDETGTEAEPNVFDLFGDPPPDTPPPEPIPVVDPDRPADLPHWTDPPTGQIPVLPNQDTSDGDAWDELAGPQWHGEDSASMESEDIRKVLAVDDEVDDHDDIDLIEEDDGVVGSDQAIDDWISSDPDAQPVGDEADDEALVLDEANDNPVRGGAVSRTSQRRPMGTKPASGRPKVPQPKERGAKPTRDPSAIPTNAPGSSAAADGEEVAAGGERLTYRQTRPRPRPQRPMADPSERDLTTAVSVGLGLVLIAAAAFWIGRLTTALLVAVVAGLCLIELTEAIRARGLHPAQLVGLVATAGLPMAVYWQGVAAIPLVLALLLVAASLWYLVGAEPSAHPALDTATTYLGPIWIGIPAAFAVLLTGFDRGISSLVAVIAITAAYDTGAFGFGSWIGQTPFHPSSPAKTWEGTVGGVIAGVAMAIVLWIFEYSAFSGAWTHAVALGVVVSVLATIGDLTESMVKRDLEIKDMSTLLPGHGGMFDRVDGLLFALPGAYYLALVLGLAVSTG